MPPGFAKYCQTRLQVGCRAVQVITARHNAQLLQPAQRIIAVRQTPKTVDLQQAVAATVGVFDVVRPRLAGAFSVNNVPERA